MTNRQEIQSDMERRPVTLVKSGLGIGGATIADLALLSYLKDDGHKAAVITGFATPDIRRYLEHRDIPLYMEPALDQYAQSDHSTLKGVLKGHDALKESVGLFSQSLCSAERSLGAAALVHGQANASLYRQHNHLSNSLMQQYAEQQEGSTVAVSESMRQELRSVNSALSTEVLPPLIEAGRFRYPKLEKRRKRDLVREMLAIEENDIVLFQPTRVVAEKGVEYSVDIAARLQSEMGRRVIMLVAGGNEPFESAATYKESLHERAERHGYRDLRFLNGSYTQNETRRTGDIMAASDAVIFPSRRESFGLGIAEASLSGLPIVAREFIGDRGEATLSDHYGDFDIIKDPLDAQIPSSNAVAALAEVIDDIDKRRKMTDKNSELVQRYTLNPHTVHHLQDTIAEL